MKSKSIQKLVIASLFAALACIATLIIQIRIGPTGGYINLGDCIVLICAWVLSPFYGAAAAGIGSMLADVISGYAAYAPATFIIKAAMALFGGIVFRALNAHSNKHLLVSCIASAIIAEAIMAFGYCAFEWVFMGLGAGALMGMPGNIVQALCGSISATVVFLLLHRNKTLSEQLDNLR